MWNSSNAKYLLQVEKPGRYVGGEFGSVLCRDADVRVALAFPDAYEIGMSHIGLSILYEIVNGTNGLAAERVFMPWPDMVAVMREQKIPLGTLESGRPLNEFDIVGFSLQYELTFTNVIAMLDMGGIPRRATERQELDPLVMVGGPVAVESEPMSPFVDLVLLGDGEEALPQVMNALAACRLQNMSRKEILARMNEFPFVFVPGLYSREENGASHRAVVQVDKSVVQPAVISDLALYPSGNGPVATIQAVFDRYSVEIARGCTEGCRFCQAGYLYRPVRERDENAIAGILHKATCTLGFDEVSLSSLSSADHSQIEQIITGLGNEYIKKRVSFSVPSLRAYGLSDEVVSVLSQLRASGVTLAPEAGSQRLRDLVNKNITEVDVLNAAARFYERGFHRIKLYFMLGLPTETDDDLVQIVELAQKIQKTGRRIAGKRAEVVVSVSTFVPKPFTPFEREEMLDESEIRRRQLLLRDVAREKRIKLKTHHVKMSVLEGILARGDARLANLIEQAVDAGALFDGWDEMFAEDIWQDLLTQIDAAAYLKKISDSDRVPWDHIDSGVTVAFRQQERDAAYAQQTTAPCGVFVDSTGKTEFICHHCGIRCKRSELMVKPLKESSPVVQVQADVASIKNTTKKPAPVIQAGTSPVRFRLEVAFFGRQMFIGHLDRMRHIMRSFSRAGLKLWYTQGFHPKPKIEAPPPVPLGTAALAEPFDVWLVDAPTPEKILEQMRDAVPADLEVRSIRPIADGEAKLSHAFDAVEYLAFVNAETAVVEAALQSLMDADTIEVVRVRKGKQRSVEIRQYVLAAEVAENITSPVSLPSIEGCVPVRMTLALVGSGGTRPDEVLAAVLPDVGPIWVVRTRWLPAENNE
ncbi:MAG: TIGR03960 family B12-binding radical SAM protein [Deltaproteobacteria bacterium]|nr:TIGR03960 family B12-binding radical SAM protein [Deltaproteobacteria bacterium]MBN2670619.1 TIGR03960 family B12-binding radical SAM protein [Deltaproteobacteria bacterium]